MKIMLKMFVVCVIRYKWFNTCLKGLQSQNDISREIAVWKSLDVNIEKLHFFTFFSQKTKKGLRNIV